MFTDRFERNGITFPPTCVRCGKSEAQRTTQLMLPYRAWWQSNPVVKAPVCRRCFIRLGIRSWASLALWLGATLGSTFYLPQWILLLLIRAQQSIFHSVSAWVFSRTFAESLVVCVLLLASFVFGRFRNQFLRRDPLKIKITDYRNDWIELTSDESQYFSELAQGSELYSD